MFIFKSANHVLSNIFFRFMVDSNVVGCSWIEVPAGKYHLRHKHHKNKDDVRNPPPISRSQIELDVSWEEFIAHQPEGDWSKVAPFRILSFDIECAGRKGRDCSIKTYMGPRDDSVQALQCLSV